VGGIYGYEEYLEAMAEPEHQEHESFMEWRGPFYPELFDADKATKRMRRAEMYDLVKASPSAVIQQALKEYVERHEHEEGE